MIAAIILAIAAELLADTFKVLTSEFLAAATLVLGITEFAFVATVTAIVIMITEPAAIQTPPIGASELIVSAGSRCRTMMQSYVFISSVNAVRISVAQPFLGNALGAIPHFVRDTGKFRFFVALSVV